MVEPSKIDIHPSADFSDGVQLTRNSIRITEKDKFFMRLKIG
jgi:hypothetical protein